MNGLNLFSFDSEKSMKFSIGPVSFSINPDYIGKMKLLFNTASIYPTQETRILLDSALRYVKSVRSSEKIECNSKDEAIEYFYHNFLSEDCKYYSEENLKILEITLQELLCDVDLWISKNKDKKKKHDEEVEREFKNIAVRDAALKGKIHELIRDSRFEYSDEEKELIFNPFRGLRYAYKDWMYELIKCDEVADFYFLHCMQNHNMKKDFIVQCIEHGDKQRALDLVDRLIKTSEYIDYAPKGGNMWELSALNTIRWLLDSYKPSEGKDLVEYSDDIRRFVVNLAERMMPYLLKDSCKVLFGVLSIVDPDRRYIDKYINTLLDDVNHYAQVPRPRGWAGAPVVNRITFEIFDCFKILDTLDRPDIIVSVLLKIRAAGSKLQPLNYVDFLRECENETSEKTYKLVYQAIKYRYQ